jgi:hypothetical protein
MPHFSLTLVTPRAPTATIVLDALLPHKTKRNPRWQSFVVGGRWSNRLLVTASGPTDSCRRGEVDLGLTRQHRQLLLTHNYEQAQRELRRGAKPASVATVYDVDPASELLLDYIARCDEHPCRTDAVLTAGGPWLELADRSFSDVFNAISPSAWLTIIDCWVARPRLRAVSK